MPPSLYSTTHAPLIIPRSNIGTGASDTASALRTQWRAPTGILPILLIVAGDIVGEALAQLSGPGIAPIVFSFGWVSYAVQAFISAIGVHALMTPPGQKKGSPGNSSSGGKVVNVGSGKVTENRSWLLDRLLRDWEYWKPREVREGEGEVLRKWGEQRRQRQRRQRAERSPPPPSSLSQNLEDTSSSPANHLVSPTKTSSPATSETEDEEEEEPTQPPHLRITLFRFSPTHTPARPSKDRLWYWGLGIALLQHGIAAIPCGLYGHWAPLFIVFVGTLLAFTTGALPQFGKEKWGSRRRSRKIVALTGAGGNTGKEGMRIVDVIVIRGAGVGLDLEEMAAGGSQGNHIHNHNHKSQSNKFWMTSQVTAWPWTRLATGVLAACWIVLLITAAGVKGDSWYLLGLGALGLVQNAFVAGAPRAPDAQGVHLEFEGWVAEGGWGETLRACEGRWPGVGWGKLEGLGLEGI